jgi:protein-tyrosine phosphatase
VKNQLPAVEGPWPGQLVVVSRPRGGDWLEDEIESWRSQGVSTVVSLLTKAEERDLELSAESTIVQELGMEFLSYPIPDYSVPASRADIAALVSKLRVKLGHGDKIVVHCRGGLGRSPLIGACLLASAGVPPETAFRRIGRVRGSTVPETGEQRQWVIDFAANLALTFPIPSA